MAHLASVGSHAINGVAELHSELLKSDVLSDFAKLWPEKFTNKTNGVTPRRWMVLSNPRLAHCITQRIGDGWIRDLYELRKLEPLVDDPDFRAEWRQIKHANKTALAGLIEQRTGVIVDPSAIFDVQVKRIHEYKRQHLNILHVIGLYHRLKTDPKFTMEPRVFVFGGKAAPGYHLAKLIIRLITAAAEIINRDPGVRDLIKVVYLPNFNVTNGQKIYPAADLSEQISTAGKEASGTGNMKFQMNGALTIGTVDGANIEICEEVGVENFFLFGLEAHEVAARRAAGYQPDGVRREQRGAAGHHPADPRRLLLARQQQPVPAAHRQSRVPRSVLRVRRLPVVRGLPGAGRPDLPRQGRLDAHVDPEFRALGQVLFGSHHPRVLRRDLEGEARPRATALPGRSEGRPAAVDGEPPHFLASGRRTVASQAVDLHRVECHAPRWRGTMRRQAADEEIGNV